MNKKEKVFRSVISNSVIGLVVIATLIFSLNISAINTSGDGGGAIYKGSSKTHVSLMINVYQGAEHVEDMLEIAKNRGVKLTFFVGGIWVEKNEELLKKMFHEGHEIGNHGYLHKDHKNLSENANYQEMNVTHQLVKGILDFEMTLFAPPSGSFDKRTIAVAQKMSYKTIMWSLDTIDWRDHDADIIFSRATKKIMAGDLVLMHPTKQTVEALDKIITEIYNKNLLIDTVSKVLEVDKV